MHPSGSMPHRSSPYAIHDHRGARWLAPMMTVLFLAVVGLFFMLVYPHLPSLSGRI